MAKGDKMNKKKIALIESGTYYHYFAINDERFVNNFDEIIYAPKLAETSLDKFDVVIVADRNHLKYLIENNTKLIEFAKNGGTLCVLGENSVERWIETINYVPTDTNFWWWLNANKDIDYKQPDLTHPFYKKMEFQECKWHYHGVYEPSNKATRIIERQDKSGGGAILYEENLGKGRLIVTSLDPFFHTGSNFMPNASKFLSGILAWVKE